jgi:hypothetical protein
MTASIGSGGSEFNHLPEVRSRAEFPPKVFVVDSTIRSLQSGVSGSLHTAADLVEIGMALDGLGVRELIVNLSWRDGPEVIAELARRRPKAAIVATFRARNERAPVWARDAIELGADDVCFESPPDVTYIERWSEEVRRAGRRVSWGFAERYEYDEIVTLSRAATANSAASLSYHDSYFRLGITPEAIQHFVRSVRRDVPEHPPIYVHLSNFYGQATMTGVAAVAAGASAVDVCMNATGHHCGHTSLAEVVMVLEDLYDVRTGIDLARITETARIVDHHSGVPLSLTMPVVGPFAFMGDGAYWAAEEHLPNDSRVHARFPFAPDVVGGPERIVWSDRTSTPEAIATRLRTLGLPAEPPIAAAVQEALAVELATARTYPGWLEDAAFAELCRDVAGSAGLGEAPA